MAIRGLDQGQPAALVVNECQNGMVDPAHGGNTGLAAEAARRGVVERIAGLARACRAAGVLVVHTTMVPRPDGVGTTANSLLLGSLVKKGAVVAGSPAAQIHPLLTPDTRDVVIPRMHGLSPFHGTELEPVLRSRGVTKSSSRASRPTSVSPAPVWRPSTAASRPSSPRTARPGPGRRRTSSR